METAWRPATAPTCGCALLSGEKHDLTTDPAVPHALLRVGYSWRLCLRLRGSQRYFQIGSKLPAKSQQTLHFKREQTLCVATVVDHCTDILSCSQFRDAYGKCHRGCGPAMCASMRIVARMAMRSFECLWPSLSCQADEQIAVKLLLSHEYPEILHNKTARRGYILYPVPYTL